MTTSELAAVILIFCGTGEDQKTLDCRDHLVNCAVGKTGEIDDEEVEKCARVPQKDKEAWRRNVDDGEKP